MRLEAFRVQNYKKIRDTGLVTVRDVTAFVGKNEAGKSSIFRALSKLNPSDGEKYDGLKEFPRKRFTDEFRTQDWPGATGVFTLSPEDRQELAKVAPSLNAVKSAEVTRYYSDKSTVRFDPAPKAAPVPTSDLRAQIEGAVKDVQALTAPDGKGEILTPVKHNILAALEAAKTGVPAEGSATSAQATSAVNAIALHANEAWQQELLAPVRDRFDKLAARAVEAEQIAQGQQWIVKHLPKFIYFDKYDVLDAAIDVPLFLSQFAADPSAPRMRTTNALFKHVGLDLSQMAALGRHSPDQPLTPEMKRQIDERIIRSGSASNAMSHKFETWWEQRVIKFHYTFDGRYFRVLVSDDLDESQIELDQRSTGMQYFFSFYLVFQVEAAGTHENAILLLDDPGKDLHPTAQERIVELLTDLASENQLLYTTHSPFMIDADHLEQARAVFESEDGTRVSEDVWPRDRDSLFPLQAALGYKIAQSLFLSKRQVIVEGISDKWIFSALDMALEAKGRTRLRRDIVVVPSAGVSKLLPLASLLIGHEIEVAALLDGDEPGRKEGKKLVDKLLAGDDRKCIFVGDFASGPELEDIFPETEYVSAVEEAYPAIKVKFDAAEKAVPGIVDRVGAFFTRTGAGDFEKVKVAAVLRDRIAAAPSKVSDTVINVVDAINVKLNALFTV